MDICHMPESLIDLLELLVRRCSCPFSLMNIVVIEQSVRIISCTKISVTENIASYYFWGFVVWLGESCSVAKELESTPAMNAVYQDKTNILFSVSKPYWQCHLMSLIQWNWNLILIHDIIIVTILSSTTTIHLLEPCHYNM